MEHFLDFIIWSLAIFGASNGIVISDLLAPVRSWLGKKSNFFGQLIHCPLCLGFWLGLLSHFFMRSPTDFWLGDAFLGSAMSWLIYIGIYRRQFNLNGEQGGCSNCGEKQILADDGYPVESEDPYGQILQEIHEER